MKRQFWHEIDPTEIETVGELLKFYDTEPKSPWIEYQISFFSKFRKNVKLHNIRGLHEEWVTDWVTRYPSQIKIERFRKFIKTFYYAYRWACGLWHISPDEIRKMRRFIKDEEDAFYWTAEFWGEEIERFRPMIKSPELCYRWAYYWHDVYPLETDRMLRKRSVKGTPYYEKILALKGQV